MDKDLYTAMINDEIDDLLKDPLETLKDAEKSLKRLHSILKNSALSCTTRKATFQS